MRKNCKENKINRVFRLNQKGMALVATLIFTFVLVSLGVALLTMTNNDLKLSTLQRESTRAFYLAETGIEKALWFINFSPNNPDGLDWRTTEDEPYNDGTAEEYFQVWVTPDEEDDDDEAIKIKFVSTGVVNQGGEYNKGTRSIEVKLIKGVAQNNSLAYNNAIFTEGDMIINGSLDVTGDIHSNGDLSIQGDGAIVLDGDGSASGTFSAHIDGASGAEEQQVPFIDFAYYKKIAERGPPEGEYYGDGNSLIINSDRILEGIHFIDGDVIIKNPCFELEIHNGAIFATGDIKIEGNPEIEITRSDGYTNPLSIIADGDITVVGNANITGTGVIQTNSTFTFNGNLNIIGCVVAGDGIFNGGGEEMNVVYDNSFQGEIVEGTGVEIWKKASWREVYL